MNLTTAWLCGFVGTLLFALTAWLDGRDVARFTDPRYRYSGEEERLLWLRVIARQIAAFSLMLMLDMIFARIAVAESARLLNASRFFLGLAEGANLLRLQYYYRLIREAEQRAVLLQALRGRRF